jgi:hypothetical protein
MCIISEVTFDRDDPRRLPILVDGVDKVVDWWAWPLIGAFLSVAVRFVCRR